MIWRPHHTLHIITVTIITIGILRSMFPIGRPANRKEKARQEPFRVLAETIPYDQKLPIRILDVGAGYGALTQFLLSYFKRHRDLPGRIGGDGETRPGTYAALQRTL